MQPGSGEGEYKYLILCCISNNGLTDSTLFVRIIPLSCQLQISGSIIYCKYFQLSAGNWKKILKTRRIVSHLTVRNYDTVTFSWLSIIILIHLVWILNILGPGLGGECWTCHTLEFFSTRNVLLSTIHFHFEKLLLETLLAKHRIRILWQIYKLQCRD